MLKSLPLHGEFQDGDPGFNTTRSAEGHVDGFTRPQGRLSSCPYFPSTQEVSEVRVEGPSMIPLHLPVESLGIRPSNSPQAFYQTVGPGCSLPSHPEYVYVPVHRRHLPCPDLQGVGYFDS